MEHKKLRFGLAFVMMFLFSVAAEADTWFFDFGPSTQTTPTYNSITNPGVHTFPGLVNSAGQTTAAALSITIPFNISSTNTNGTTTPAANIEFLASATRDSFFGNVVIFQNRTAPNSQLRLTNLDPSQLYDFTIFASRMSVTDNRQTEYRIGGVNVETTYLNPTANTSEVATVIGIQPTPEGTITLDLQPGPENVNGNRFFYLGAMKVVSRAPAPVTCGTDDSALNDKLTKYPYVANTSPYTMGHFLYRPAGYAYAPCKKYPLLVWLHGLGETCGRASLDTLNTRAALNSPGRQILQGTAYADARPFLSGLILQPQSCTSWNAANIDAMIDYIKTQVRVDEDRIYVTGLSLGGGGTWSYAAGRSTEVAAIVPVAGTESALSSIQSASHVPTWAFHNYNDSNVGPGPGPETDLFRCKSYTHRVCTIEHIDRMIPFASTRVMADYNANGGATMASTDRTASLGRLGNELLPTKWTWADGRAPQDPAAKTVMTIFATGGHQGWEAAYGMQNMWQWLYAQRREPAATLKINSPLIAPTNTGVNSGATVTISAKIALGGVPISQIVTDLKNLGGSNVAPLTYNSVTKAYEFSHTLPTSGLAPGTKGIGITAVDASGNRTVKYVTITLDP